MINKYATFIREVVSKTSRTKVLDGTQEHKVLGEP
jgi:hypothetical protein